MALRADVLAAAATPYPCKKYTPVITAGAQTESWKPACPLGTGNLPSRTGDADGKLFDMGREYSEHLIYRRKYGYVKSSSDCSLKCTENT